MPPCLTISNIRYVSRVKWSNLGKGVAPSTIPRCSSYWKGRFRVLLDNYGFSMHFLFLYPSMSFNFSLFPSGFFQRLSSTHPFCLCVCVCVWSAKTFLSIFSPFPSVLFNIFSLNTSLSPSHRERWKERVGNFI